MPKRPSAIVQLRESKSQDPQTACLLEGVSNGGKKKHSVLFNFTTMGGACFFRIRGT